MAIERFLVHRVSFDRGVKLPVLDGRFGVSMKDDQTMVFDDVAEAEAFVRALSRAIAAYKGEE